MADRTCLNKLALFTGVLARWVVRLTVLFPALAFAQAPAPSASPTLKFTAEDRAWIAAHPVIRVGLDVPYAPYALADQSGQAVGIDPDFLELIARRTGLKFEKVFGVPWSQMQEDFKAGKVDLLMNLSHSVEREGYMIFTDSYNNAPCAIVTRGDSPYILDARQLRGKKVGVIRGYVGLRQLLQEFVPDSIMVEYDDPVSALTAVARGDDFAFLDDIVNAAYLAKSQRLTNLRLGSVLPGFTGVFMGVRKDWDPLARIINQAVRNITPLEHRQIIDRWIGLDIADQWWLKAFRVAVGVAVAALLVFGLLYVRARRLAGELVERRRIQTELEHTRDRLAQISEEKSEIMRMVAHDLRSPLTGIMLASEMLCQDPSPEQQATAGGINTAANQMMRLINELTAVQSLEEGVRVFTFGPHDAAALMRDSARTFVASAANKGIAIVSTLPEDRLIVHTDGDALQQVINNLVSNAVKFSPRDSTIRLAVGRSDGLCRISVSDQGPGVAASEQEEIFKKYGRGSAPPTGGEKSTGLGLWIVRRLIANLHGRVWCESQLGQGSVFIVELPVTAPTAAR